MRKLHKSYVAAAVLSLGCLPALAEVFTIPATQEEFEQWTQIVPEGAEKWKLVTDNGADPYASVVTCITDFNSKEPGQILLAPKQYDLKAGDKMTFNLVLSNSEPVGSYRYCVIGVPENPDTPYKLGFRSSIYYNSDAEDTWLNKSDGEFIDFTIDNDGKYRFGVAVMGQKDFTAEDPAFFFKSIDIKQIFSAPEKIKWASLRPAAPDPDGKRAVTLTFTWPSKTIEGASLSTVRGKIYRSTTSGFSYATLVADIEGTPGAEQTYVDCAENNPETAITEDGKYFYWVKPYITVGDQIAEGSEGTYAIAPWVGFDGEVKPLDSSKVSLERTDNGIT